MRANIRKKNYCDNFFALFLYFCTQMIYINDETERIDLNLRLEELPPQRREQALRFKHEQGRRLCVAAYLLLQEGLRMEYGISEPPILGYHEGGKPYIMGHQEIHFNLSHCQAGALCGLSSRPIGVDMEAIRPFKESLARYTMNDEEMEQILGSPSPEVAFTRLWTMKESLLKLTGKGIGNDLRSVLAEHRHDVTHTTVVHSSRQYVYSICEWKEGISV